ncbi:Retrovirus-related Pol polyprotein from transposon TNT 1-94 [Vitis vinifera]|uniref:Retrovirus-related Pol polyprotein from transposon TNT 1-94 n=1 Tax=Vitis vinifera TaxID=29760 RepID=A0A438JWS7_VITVI|nr:Retrovirus-related Pol polyprotein from transposon TNT 1-94 [Vitis vinifera]
MYITMDVTFVETETFFPPNSPLQGKTRQEEQNWIELNWPSVSEIYVEPRQPEHVSLAIEHHEDDHEAHVTSPSVVPENPTPENDPEVSSFNTNILAPPIGYVLPNRHNRGKPPSRYSPDIEERRSRYLIANYVTTKKLNEPLKTFVHNISGCHVPTRVEEALGDPKWTQAIKDEMEALMKNKTWNLVPLPEGKKIVGCKWVFSIKHKADRSIERYKARLMAKGYTQTYANLNWPLHQFDVKNAFLHGGLEEEDYMDILPGYSVTTGTNEQGKVTALIVYVDDMVIIGDDIEEISRLQGQLASEFEMKNLDIAYAVSVVSQFMHCPSEEHMEAIIRILRLGGNISDRKSTSGYFTFVGGNLVTWRSKKQKVVALSSAEVEFHGMAKGLCELLWLKDYYQRSVLLPSLK